MTLSTRYTDRDLAGIFSNGLSHAQLAAMPHGTRPSYAVDFDVRLLNTFVEIEGRFTPERAAAIRGVAEAPSPIFRTDWGWLSVNYTPADREHDSAARQSAAIGIDVYFDAVARDRALAPTFVDTFHEMLEATIAQSELEGFGLVVNGTTRPAAHGGLMFHEARGQLDRNRVAAFLGELFSDGRFSAAVSAAYDAARIASQAYAVH